MFGLNNPISSALNMLASLSPEAPLDVSPDFDWRRGDLRSEPRRAPSSGLTGQISINDPLYDWSNGTSPAPSNRAPAPPSIYSNTSNHRVSTPSRYSCLSDPNGSGVQFCPIIQAPILHTPTARAPTSLDFQYPSSSASTPVPYSSISTPISYATPRPTPSSATSTPYTTARSTPSSSTSTSGATTRSTPLPFGATPFAPFSPTTPPPIAPTYVAPSPAAAPSASPVAPPPYTHPRPASTILGQSTGSLLPSPLTHGAHMSSWDSRPVESDSSPHKEAIAWDKARPLFRPETPPSLEAPLQVSAQHSGSKRKVPPARMNPPPKQRRRVAKEVIEVESDSEGSDYAGMKLYDTGYQSVDDKVRVKAKALPKAMVSRPTKGRGKSPPKSRAIIEDDEDNDEVGDDEDSESRGKVKVKEEPVGKPIKEEPIQEQKRHALI